MQNEPTSDKPATELSADAPDFRLPHEEAAAPVASASAAGAETNATMEAGSTQAPKHPPPHPNGIPTENGVDDRAISTTALENGLNGTAESVNENGESGAERREDEGADTHNSARGGAVAKMVLSLEGGLKGRAAPANGLPNGLPNGTAPGKEEPLLGKDPIVVQANGE